MIFKLLFIIKFWVSQGALVVINENLVAQEGDPLKDNVTIKNEHINKCISTIMHHELHQQPSATSRSCWRQACGTNQVSWSSFYILFYFSCVGEFLKDAFFKSRGALLEISFFFIFDLEKSPIYWSSLCYLGPPGPCQGPSGEEKKFEI